MRVISFNLLADSKQCEEEWAATPAGALSWGLRRWRLLEVLLQDDPDVLLLQEVDTCGDPPECDLGPELIQAGYQGVLAAKQPPMTTAPAGVAVFYRSDRYHLMHQDASLDFAVIAVLKDSFETGSGEPFIVVSAHLKSGKTLEAELERSHQVSSLLDHVLNLARENRNPRVVIGADFNAAPITDKKAGEPLAYRAALTHRLRLSSAYRQQKMWTSEEEQREPPCTTWKLRPKGEIKRTVDYVFCSPSLDPAALLAIPSESEMPEERLPAYAYPSDHFALGVDFGLEDTAEPP